MMTIIYTVLEIAALLAIIIIPLAGPKKKQVKRINEVSNIAVNENGFLEIFTRDLIEKNQVQ
jgi:hypothetical protein